MGRGKKLCLLVNFAFLLLFFHPSQVHSYKTPADSGRMSLIQVENGQIVNQRDGGNVYSYSLSPQLVSGRTTLRQALNVSNSQNVQLLPAVNNVNLQRGTISFWTLKNNWNNNLDNWFFRMDVGSSFVPNDDFQIRKYSDGKIYSGFEFARSIFSVENLDPQYWHLITITYATGENIKTYIDGVLAAVGNVYDGVAYFNSTSSCPTAYLCWGGWPSAYYADSVMEDMQTFNYPLSEQQIMEMYNSTVPAVFYNHINPSITNINLDANPIVIGQQLTAIATVNHVGYSGNHSYQWDWGDGNTDNLVNGTHVYAEAGNYTITLSVTDSEGDSGTASLNVSVQTSTEAINSLINTVSGMNLANGINNSLDAKLSNAQNALSDANQNNDVAAVNSLQSFINSVEAQRGNQITNEQADQLILQANLIINSLS